MNDKVKIGLFGIGHLGKIHLKCLQMLSDKFEIVGAYDPDTKTTEFVNKEFNIPIFDNIDHLLDRVEAVDIVSPTSTHFDIASVAIQSSKHVFVEKPVASTRDEGIRLMDLHRQYPSVIQVGHVERFNPAYLSVKDLDIQPLFIECHRLAQFNMRGTDVSVILDLMIHDLDLILHIVKSKVVSISANGVCIVSQTPDIGNVRLEFENGCTANITASRLSLKNMRKMRVFQPDAYISMDFLDKSSQIVRLVDEDGPEDGMVMETAKGMKKLIFDNPSLPEVNAIKEELNAFADSIINEDQPLVSLEDGVNALILAHDINDKIKTNEVAMSKKI